jgi:RNA polymerase sigma-70 factor (ECF subfamily)
MEAARRVELTQLLRELREGDRSAFRPVFEALWPVLLAFTKRLGPNLADAEDAAQRSLIRVFGRIAEFDPARDGLTWALAIAAYEVRTLQRQCQRRREAPDSIFESVESGGETVEEALSRRSLWAALEEALGTLSAADRDTVLLSLQDRDVEHAAADSAARKRRQRAVERLRLAVRRLYAE